ncbi:hypothetical protein ACH4NF_34715 [Streptomyces sp. NPDC017248]|uniref:hypothetical protein n=1 Tax=unclassified Streptomyces TaxID=2593676 RepID=UPI00378F1CB2
MMAALVVAVPQTTHAADRPLNATPLISWNMKRSSNTARTGGKWRNSAERMTLAAPTVMLQEAGPTPSAPPESALCRDECDLRRA